MFGVFFAMALQLIRMPSAIAIHLINQAYGLYFDSREPRKKRQHED